MQKCFFLLSFGGYEKRIKEDPSVKDRTANKENDFLPVCHPRIAKVDFRKIIIIGIIECTQTHSLCANDHPSEQTFTDMSLFFHIITKRGGTYVDDLFTSRQTTILSFNFLRQLSSLHESFGNPYLHM